MEGVLMTHFGPTGYGTYYDRFIVYSDITDMPLNLDENGVLTTTRELDYEPILLSIQSK